jgi:2-polyprenyl-6-methoxyphenol hydroxylase-like FAD-dependent oxidoreductase
MVSGPSKQMLWTLTSIWLTDDLEWNAGGSKENLGKIFKDFGPRIAALISHVDDRSLKLWSLLDMEVLPTWVNGRLALMGDAAHPFLPRK